MSSKSHDQSRERSPKEIAAGLNQKGERILEAVDAADGDDVPTSFITDWTGYDGDSTRYLRNKFVREGLLREVDADPGDTRGTSSTVYRLEGRGQAVLKYIQGEGVGETAGGETLSEVAATADDAYEIASTQKMAMQQYRERVDDLEREVEDLRETVETLRGVIDEQAATIREQSEYIDSLHERDVEKTPRRVEILRRAFENEFEVDLRKYAES